MEKIRTLFIGSAEFGIPSLIKIDENERFELVGVITQPDRPVGRKKELTPTPVKSFVTQNMKQVEVLGPESIRKSAKEILDRFQPDLIIVAAYGQIIPDEILDYPKYKCLNLHGSILPKLRGAVPVQMAILQNFKKTGVTLQRMVAEMDKGPIISTRELEIEKDETTGSLMEKLSQKAAEIIQNDLEKWCDGKLEEVAQDDSKATYCYQKDIAKEQAEITARTDVELAERMIRAFNPWPIAWFNQPKTQKRIKVFQATVARRDDQMNDTENMQLVVSDGQLRLILSGGELLLEEVQLEGKEKRPGSEYLWLASKE